MDSSTVAAWVAFLIALLALVVALAQAVQQYLATSLTIRKCDKTVWGPMPGRSGYRTWSWTQFRFKVLLEMPNIFIPSEYWRSRGTSRLYPDSKVVMLLTPFDQPAKEEDLEDAIRYCSEAGWVSFTRQVSYVCPDAVRFGLVLSDADRWPTDLPVIPMQVSLRDMVALGLAIGMRISYADERGWNLDMQGPSGNIWSTFHPLLGVYLHFSAFTRLPSSFHRGLRSRDISKSWLDRLQGIASVAGRTYTAAQRGYYEGLEQNWRHVERRTVIPQRIEASTKLPEPIVLVFEDSEECRHEVPIEECMTWEVSQSLSALVRGPNSTFSSLTNIPLGPPKQFGESQHRERLFHCHRTGTKASLFNWMEAFGQSRASRTSQNYFQGRLPDNSAWKTLNTDVPRLFQNQKCSPRLHSQ
jgi:hypothetical protein